MFEGEGEVPPQAPSIKIINLSFGDPAREFSHAMSPCARLLDWLSWKYKVMFCVSAGNYSASIDLGVNDEFNGYDDNEKVRITLQAINQQANLRRLISPAESINSITVGAVHHDDSVIERLGNRVDLLPLERLPSPINRLGYGFRRSVKPEIFLPGGRQLYDSPMLQADTSFPINVMGVPSGQKVVTEGTEGARSSTTYTRGTSNATALATRAAAKIYETIEQIRQIYPEKIPEEQVSILIKALLVHGASKGDAYTVFEEHLKSSSPPRKWKEFASKFLGYGEVNVERVLSCTEQRATVIGCGTLTQRQKHEYRFPLPPSLANENTWRRLTITLAWFSPINSNHRNFRQAALHFSPPNVIYSIW
ncbi:MAG: S8 family serine peptidase [Cocleimonas sp.]